MHNYLVDHHEPCLCHPTGLEHVVRGTFTPRATDTLRVLTLNARHGRGSDRHSMLREAGKFRRNVGRIAKFLRDAPADLVALQEADGPSFWSGSRHHVEEYSDVGGFGEFAHGLHFTLCRPRFGLSYGTALLSRMPLSCVESHPFQARPFDPKGFVISTITFGGREIDVVSVHLDMFRPVQRRQVANLVRLLRRRSRPLVLMGDLNSTGRRARSAVRRIAEDLDLRTCGFELATWPTWRPRLPLDWILVSRDLEFCSCRTRKEPLSDHLAVEAEITWGASA